MKDKVLLNKVLIVSFLFQFFSICPIEVVSQQKNIRPSLIPTALLPEEMMDILINEVSGEMQLNNERLLASFEHKRSAEEYEKVFYESKIIFQKLKEYGIQDCGIEEVPLVLLGSKVWNAQNAELWMVEPEQKKLIDLDDVPACLAEQSQTSDVTAELIYVGSGSTEKGYEGKDVKDKIVLATGRAYEVHNLAVIKKGAKGVLISSAGNSDYDPDEVGRDTLARNFSPAATGVTMPTFGFMISARMGEQLCKLLADGIKVVLHAKCQSNYYPYRNEVVWALIKGNEEPEEELILTAHLFEEMAYQGANDNASGSVSILETARVIQRLITEGKISRPKRSIRFLWVDEQAGTLGYLMKYPKIMKRIFANINEDMVGEALVKHLSSFQLTQTPHSMPSYLNDVLANFIEYVGETNRDIIINRPVKFMKPILSPTGSKDPFYYHIDKFYGGSDHTIFLEGGIRIPAIQLGVWPDMWYHTNLDRPDKSDSTQLKRVSVIDTASALFMANASKKEALELLGEIVSRGAIRIGEEEKRAYANLSKTELKYLAETYKEARNLIHQAFDREALTLKSAGFFATDDPSFSAQLNTVCRNLLSVEQFALGNLASHYKAFADQYGMKAPAPSLTPEERRLDRLVPERTKAFEGYFDTRTFPDRTKGKKLPEYKLGRYEDFEIRNFINNSRSILEIRNAVSAEFRPIPLADVENYIKVLEIGGMVIIGKKS